MKCADTRGNASGGGDVRSVIAGDDECDEDRDDKICRVQVKWMSVGQGVKKII